MTDWEEKLPPIVRERLAKAGDLTSEEKERMKDSERLDSLLSEFYTEALTSEGLWAALKEYRDHGKGRLLKEVQLKLIDSLSFSSGPAEIQKRKEGILAVETLKEHQNTPVLEAGLNSIEQLQRRYGEEVQRAYNELRAQVERDPRLRMEQVKQGQNTAMVQLSVDEAVKRNPQWQEFLSQHEKRYGQEFARIMEGLKMGAK